VPPLAHKSKM